MVKHKQNYLRIVILFEYYSHMIVIMSTIDNDKKKTHLRIILLFIYYYEK